VLRVGEYGFSYSLSEVSYAEYIDPRLGLPEPGTWALLIGGFGMAGSALRRRRASSDPAIKRCTSAYSAAS
jgi:hypothetical protein